VDGGRVERAFALAQKDVPRVDEAHSEVPPHRASRLQPGLVQEEVEIRVPEVPAEVAVRQLRWRVCACVGESPKLMQRPGA